MARPEEEKSELRKKVETLQDKLYWTAKDNPEKKFYSLWDKVMREDVLRVAWSEVRKNQGAAGVDGQTIYEIETEIGVENFLYEIQQSLCEKNYWVPPVKGVSIPKSDGSQRVLGIPTVRDRVVQTAVKIVLEPIFESDFSDCSWGYRPGRSCKDASKEVRKWLNFGYENVIDGDISSFFDSIDHGILIELVERRVSDGGVLKLIREWLRAGILKGGELLERDTGTPQGGVISPLLANIYLDKFDKSFERLSSAFDWHGPKLVRYADDFVILSIRPVDNVAKAIGKILGDLGLKLNPEKTRLVKAEKGFDFLSFHFTHKSSERKGKRITLYMPSSKALNKVRKSIREIVGPHVSHVLPDKVIGRLNLVLIGWTNYFRHTNASQAFQKLQSYVNYKVRRYLKRRRGSRGGARCYDDTYLYEILNLKFIASGLLETGCYNADNELHRKAGCGKTASPV